MLRVLIIIGLIASMSARIYSTDYESTHDEEEDILIESSPNKCKSQVLEYDCKKIQFTFLFGLITIMALTILHSLNPNPLRSKCLLISCVYHILIIYALPCTDDYDKIWYYPIVSHFVTSIFSIYISSPKQ